MTGGLPLSYVKNENQRETNLLTTILISNQLIEVEARYKKLIYLRRLENMELHHCPKLVAKKKLDRGKGRN